MLSSFLAFFRSTSFHSSSLIIPDHMTIHAALISSPALRANSLVLGTVPTLGFDVARFINKYQVSHYTDLDLSCWPHQTLTESCDVMKVYLNSHPKKPLKVERKKEHYQTVFHFSIVKDREEGGSEGKGCGNSSWHCLLVHSTHVWRCHCLNVSARTGESDPN